MKQFKFLDSVQGIDHYFNENEVYEWEYEINSSNVALYKDGRQVASMPIYTMNQLIGVRKVESR